ncbi:hypothetical protein Ait01nite_068770 [Actinoplanes italicus]|uniref:Uncharacterized protein n=1 Tax=Actinoplanes italicus TaxID=113567 RepID=A0A2T0K1G3_9ACTN|nr:hypothetical protein [Actinoplanes italicus]PRX16624.1 hypothetical protein CLV67_119205 [Actinoplanes italicus]GIE33832.1 hypothetical protein Ait01nite_068770 [Actinoplanes italicus]
MVSLVLHEVDLGITPAARTVPWFTGKAEDFDAGSLHYSLFPARVTLSVGDLTIMGPRTMVPLFDFLAVLAFILPNVRDGKPASIGFTESADRIRLRPVGADDIDVTYLEARSHTGRRHRRERVSARADRGDLTRSFTTFLETGRALLIDAYPDLVRNPLFGKLTT